MKFLIPMFLSLAFTNVYAEHAPIKHSIDPTCQYQVSRAIIQRTTLTYGSTHQILTPGLFVDIYAKLESFPTISLSKSVITIRHRITGQKFDVYYSGRSGSVGLGSNGQPIHSCRVSIDQITQTQYEALGNQE